jgi:glutamine amidotransferase
MGEFSAAIKKDNFYGVQFHPEKSAAMGEMIIKNFLEL